MDERDEREGELSARILLEVARELGATHDVDRLLKLVLTRVSELLRAERALFALCDETGRTQRLVSHNLEAGEGGDLPVSHGVIREVIEQRRPVVVENAESDATYSSRPSVQELGLRFMVGMPVPLGEKIIGVLYVDSRVQHLEDITDRIELLEAIAKLVGTSVENARLFEEQHYRARLLAQLVHDFRTPLQVIDMNVRLLGRATDRRDSESQEIIGDIAACSKRLARMAQTTLELCSMEAATARPPLVHLAMSSAVEEHLRMLQLVASASGVRLRLQAAEPTSALTTPERVWIALDNLIFNALKYARRDSDVTVALKLRPDIGPEDAVKAAGERERRIFRRAERLAGRPGSPFVEVSVHNLGPPISAERMKDLFEEFARDTEASDDRKSTGLGLSIVEQCVHQLGGVVWVNSSQVEGTKFYFTLPTELA